MKTVFVELIVRTTYRIDGQDVETLMHVLGDGEANSLDGAEDLVIDLLAVGLGVAATHSMADDLPDAQTNGRAV